VPVVRMAGFAALAVAVVLVIVVVLKSVLVLH
jgi:hypothetical protein